MSENESGTQSTGGDAGKEGKSTPWEVFIPSRHGYDRDAIFVASFPPIIYLWPLMLGLFGCGIVQYMGWAPETTIAWVALVLFAFNVLVIVQDFDQKKFIILCLAVVVLVLGGWIVNMKGFTVLDSSVSWLENLDPRFSTSAYFLLGVILVVQFIWGLLVPIFDYWRLEHNEFVHFIQPFGRDISVPRSGSTITKEVPDIFEYILTLGGGSLVIRREGQVSVRIPHIPLLGVRMKAIDEMLSETRVTTRQRK